jgi:hypothetical protein
MARRVAPDEHESVIYLYGVTQSPAGAAPSVAAVDGKSKIQTIDCAGMVCWVSRVPAAEYGEKFSQNLEDLDWLAAVSVRHQRAVGAIAESHDMLPARLGTVFLTEESLQADIRRRKASLKRDLRRIAGMQEWGVKIFVSPQQRVLPKNVKTGREYLEAKSQMLRTRKPAIPDEDVKMLASELARLGTATAEGGKISGGARDLQYQVSVLVKKADRKKLEQLLRRFSREWKDTRKIECSGPWPPYSFVSHEGSSKSE